MRKPHRGQASILAEAARFNVVSCGRRWGKSVLGQDRLIEQALLGHPVGWFSPTYKMLTEIWREMTTVLKPAISRPSEQEHRHELMTGGVVEMWSLDRPDSARGRKYKRIVIDEAAMIPNLFDVWHAILRPTLMDLKGDAWILSTPKGRNGFWTFWQWGQDEAYREWRSWQRPTSENPFIAPGEIEAAKQTLPERIFAQEILAQFLDDAGGVFRRVLDATTAQEHNGVGEYVIGVDWGKHNDFTALTVMDVAKQSMVYLDRFNQIDYALQVGRLKALCEKYKPAALVIERNSMGEPLIEQLQRDGLPVQPFTTTNATKAVVIDALALAFERGDIRILPDPVLIGELQAYETERLPSGLLRYSAPEGMHDDTVMSLALAWYGTLKPNKLEIVETNPFYG